MHDDVIIVSHIHCTDESVVQAWTEHDATEVHYQLGGGHTLLRDSQHLR